MALRVGITSDPFPHFDIKDKKKTRDYQDFSASKIQKNVSQISWKFSFLGTSMDKTGEPMR
jgi:hypothetical protein